MTARQNVVASFPSQSNSVNSLIVEDDYEKTSKKDVITSNGNIENINSSLKWVTIVLFAQVGYNWGFYTLLTELPTYLDNIQHFSLSSNGLLSSLPYAIFFMTSIVYSLFVDRLTKNRTLKIITIRKMSVALSSYLPMLALIGCCFVGCDRTLAMVMLCLAVGFCGPNFSGYMCSHADMAPRYAGTLMGITNTFATIPGFVSPIVVGAITKDNQTLKAWQTVFLISAGIYGVTATLFMFTASAEIQPWNYYETERKKSSASIRGSENPEEAEGETKEGKTR